MVEVSFWEIIPMKLPFLRKVIPLFLALPTMLQPALAWESGYWKRGYWCDVTNNFCGTHPSLYDEHYPQPSSHDHHPDTYDIEYDPYHTGTYIEPATIYTPQQPLIRLCIAIIGCN